jgi:hypothetical protein
LARQNEIEKIGTLRRAARRLTALMALAGAAGACAALPSLVSGAGAPGETDRMTGVGQRGLGPSVEVRHAFDIRCDAAGTRQKLLLRWGRGERFRLTRLASVSCFDDLNVGGGRPAGGFDTVTGRGRGRLNGRRGATIRFRFVDLGESRPGDAAYIHVRDRSGATALAVEGALNAGAHRAR